MPSMNPTAIIESILFVASKPMTLKALTKASSLSSEEVTAAIDVLTHTYEEREAGITIAKTGETVQLVTTPAVSSYVAAFREKDYTGELTKAQLETLTVIAYQQPITRPEIEEIRGVNCSVILRTLQVRGLITERNSDDAILPVFELTVESLRALGISTVADLPEYETLSQHPHLDQSENDYAAE